MSFYECLDEYNTVLHDNMLLGEARIRARRLCISPLMPTARYSVVTDVTDVRAHNVCTNV